MKVEAIATSVEPKSKIDTKEDVKQEDTLKEEEKVKEEKVKEEKVKEDKEETNIQAEKVEKQIVSIVPVNRLWFGLIDLESRVRDHFSVADSYVLDVSSKRWLVATSSASFSLKSKSDTKAFSNNKEHYFLIDKEEIKVLTKSEYVALGGWDQW
jgi:hypothetical protein